MKYISILLIVFLQGSFKFCQAQKATTVINKGYIISVDDFKADSVEKLLKFQPTYKLVKCLVRFYFRSKGEIATCMYPAYKEHAEDFERMRRVLIKDDVVTFDDIVVMNGDKKIHLTPKNYILK
jgi:hypothetical protein